ncbi:hypothetical protein ACJZ2D_010063 [Fusarium nematophilum]
MCIAAAQDMQDLLAQNCQLNAMRSQIGGPPVPPVDPKPVTEAMVRLMGVKDEVYGDFPAGFGDNHAGDSREAQGLTNGTLAEDQGMQLAMPGFFLIPDQPYPAQLSS